MPKSSPYRRPSLKQLAYCQITRFLRKHITHNKHGYDAISHRTDLFLCVANEQQ
ncbi:MAG TPA: hypothetical protein VFU82_01460 [Gammaproteobacteria bacterium]|nr:hypothetical protein [Gammaproteobacteria bacterium]